MKDILNELYDVSKNLMVIKIEDRNTQKRLDKLIDHLDKTIFHLEEAST